MFDTTPDTTPSLQPHYRTFVATTDRSAPVLPLATLASWRRPLVLLAFAWERLVPAVPFESLCQIHAPYTPVAACPVTRCPAGFSQKSSTPLVLTTSLPLRRVVGRFAFARLSDPHLRSLIRAFPATLTTMTLNHSGSQVV